MHVKVKVPCFSICKAPPVLLALGALLTATALVLSGSARTDGFFSHDANNRFVGVKAKGAKIPERAAQRCALRFHSYHCKVWSGVAAAHVQEANCSQLLRSMAGILGTAKGHVWNSLRLPGEVWQGSSMKLVPVRGFGQVDCQMRFLC